MTNQKDTNIDFHHPFKPYGIQLQLMNAIYETIDKNYKIGLFESPTGTGKTLSIICSTMTWLRHYKQKEAYGTHVEGGNSSGSENDSDSDVEWVKNAYQKSITSRTKNKLKDYEKHLDKVEQEFKDNTVVTKAVVNDSLRKRPRVLKAEINEDDLLPKDYYSDTETSREASSSLKRDIRRLIQKTETQMNFDGSIHEDSKKIFFSSRTHSQLNQFAGQLSLPHFESSLDDTPERTKYLALGSRKQLCINSKVNKFNSNDSSLGDACLDLQSSKDGCEFLSKENSDIKKKFADTALTKINDIEDLAVIGKEMKMCPYYNVREGVEFSEVVSLPYQILLEESARKTFNLNIKNSIVIIDEAHNLLDVINSMNSISITVDELNLVVTSLKAYMKKFTRRLNTGNRVNLMKLMKLCQVVGNFIDSSSPVPVGTEINTESIFKSTTGDLINIHRIDQYLNKSKIAYKIETYMGKLENVEYEVSRSNPLLFKITKFLKYLNNPSKEGKFFWDETNYVRAIGYRLLDPSEVFRNIVENAKCVLLCGGTMEPMDDYLNYLFPYVPSEKIRKFSCDHIIPQENLKAYSVSTINGITFDFSYTKRNNTNIINALGVSILDTSLRVPYGMVVFFPSYNYLTQVVEEWKKTNMFEKINKTKRIFMESKSSDQTSLLNQYSELIRKEKRGAIFLAVVGGRLSEGINFSDDLARAVLMVGMPYPNIYSGETITRKKFIETRTLEMGGTIQDAKKNSNDYYENVCMRAVNQCIGRSIRHSNDYAVIYLIDRRYETPRIKEKLSGWVQKRLVSGLDHQKVLKHTEAFFEAKIVTNSK